MKQNAIRKTPEPPTDAATERRLRRMCTRLLAYYGRQHWWPAESSFEVIVGAFLTQNTNSKNVEKAITRLRAAEVLTVEKIREISTEQLEELIRSSGYFRQKAKRLNNFVHYLDEKHGGSLEQLFLTTTQTLRAELLSLHGVGHETADSILSYAGQHEVFVVDAYTRRILERHGIVGADAKYDSIRQLVERVTESLPAPKREKLPRHLPSPASESRRPERARALQELHAVIVRTGNEFCRSTPRCESCPLRRYLPARPTGDSPLNAAPQRRDAPSAPRPKNRKSRVVARARNTLE